MLDLTIYSKIGAQIWGTKKESEPSDLFVQLFLQHRPEVVNEILETHPSFSFIAQMMNYSEENDILQKMGDEYSAMTKLFREDKSLANDIYFSILCAAQGAVLYWSNENAKPILTFLIEHIDSINAEPIGVSSIILLVVALWFSNYSDYQNQVYQMENELRREGYYD